MRLRAVVFDLDDTLYLESDYVRSGFRAVGDFLSDKFGASDFYEKAIALFQSGERGKIFDHVLPLLGVPSNGDLIHDMVSCYRRHRPMISLLPDARDLLSWTQGRVRTGIITDGPSESQNMKLDALGLRAFVDRCICTDDYGREFWKPHRRSFEDICDSLKCEGPECIYIADNPLKDFVAPNALGWKTIQIVRPGSLHAQREAPLGGVPGRVISDLCDLPRDFGGCDLTCR